MDYVKIDDFNSANLESDLPQLSVIMPAHNAERTIKTAARSTLMAMPANAELLIFLDACTDRTRQELEAIHDKRLRIIEATNQHGVAAALNALLAQARGRLIARMDSDDICLPWRFRSQLRKIAKTKADILFGNAVLFGRSLQPFGLLPQFPIRLPPQQGALALLLTNPFVHPSMIGTAAAMKALGGYRETPAEDYDMWLRASLAGMRMERSAGYAILYRVHDNQLTQQAAWKQKLQKDNSLFKTRADLAHALLGFEIPLESDLAIVSRAIWRDPRGGLIAKWLVFRALGVKATWQLLKTN